MQTISAIDAGSNAIGMVVGRVNMGQDQVQVIEKIRIPVRLDRMVLQNAISVKPVCKSHPANLFLRKLLNPAWKSWNEDSSISNGGLGNILVTYGRQRSFA